MDIMKIMRQVAEKHEFDWCSEYGEPGYGNMGTEVIILGDWNKVDIDKYPHISAACREAGIEMEWYDEWYVDHDNDKCWRTQPDSYFWQSSLYYGDGYVLTPDDDASEWIEEMMNDPQRALTARQVSVEELVEAGFQQWPDDDTKYENGFHQGMDDDPVKIFDRIHESFSDISDNALDIVFYISESSQFYITFKAFVRVNWKSIPISSNGFSHDMQVDDVLTWMRGEVPEHVYNRLLASYPEIDRRVLDGAYFDCEAMNCDVEWSSWIADAIEETGYVFWEEGEPWARVLPDGAPVTV